MLTLIDFPPETELQDILCMLEAEYIDVVVQIQAINVLAKLTIEDANHQQIVEAGGVTSLLTILRNRKKHETIHKFAAVALANLAMNENNHELIIIQGGIGLLSSTAANGQDPQTLKIVAEAIANLCGNEAHQEIIMKVNGLTSLLMLLRSTEDENMQRIVTEAIANFAIHNANIQNPQTLKMIAGAIANLCGNDKLQIKLRSEVGIVALLGMAKYEHPEVLAQIARGMANFARCETRSSTQGTEKGKSLLIEDGALSWIVQNAKTETSATRRHIELALCYLGKHEANMKDMVKEGALWELVRISRDCSCEDIRDLAKKTLTSNHSFLTELKEAYKHCVVEADVLTSLIMLLSHTTNETLHKFAATAIFILALNTNHELITDQGGIGLLSSTAANAQDPDTLAAVAAAISNLCANDIDFPYEIDKLQTQLISEGGIAALLEMIRCEHPDVVAPVASGIANFVSCEAEALIQETKIHKSIFLKDGVLSWIVQKAKSESLEIRQDMELTLCHLAKYEVNAKEMVKGKAMWELLRISRDCSTEYIRSLAHKTLTSSPTFLTALRRLHVDPRVVTDNAVCSSVIITDMDYNFVVDSKMRNELKFESSSSAQEANLKSIMEICFTKMLMFLRNSKDETVQSDVAFVICNFALSKRYQEQIMDKGCISLLWSAAATAQDPQTITMFAKAIANLCENKELHTKLRSKGGIAALLEMAARTQHLDVFAEVARGFANFASSESKISAEGHNRRKSTLIEDGALSWIIEKAKTGTSIIITLYIEIALCHLAQHEENAEEMVKGGAIWELVRISRECSRVDFRVLVHQILTTNPIFLTELKRIYVESRDIDGTSKYLDNNLNITVEKNLVRHSNIIYEAVQPVLKAESENVITATYYKGKEQLANLFTTVLGLKRKSSE